MWPTGFLNTSWRRRSLRVSLARPLALPLHRCIRLRRRSVNHTGMATGDGVRRGGRRGGDGNFRHCGQRPLCIGKSRRGQAAPANHLAAHEARNTVRGGNNSEIEPTTLPKMEGELVRTTKGKWVTEAPNRCPNGHPLGPNLEHLGARNFDGCLEFSARVAFPMPTPHSQGTGPDQPRWVARPVMQVAGLCRDPIEPNPNCLRDTPLVPVGHVAYLGHGGGGHHLALPNLRGRRGRAATPSSDHVASAAAADTLLALPNLDAVVYGPPLNRHCTCLGAER